MGYEVTVVVGGGNICRGSKEMKNVGIQRLTADYMGMLSTAINAIMLRDKLETEQLEARVLSPLPLSPIVEQYVIKRAIKHLEKGRILVFACGIGNPLFTTDTSAVLRAVEMKCDLVLKGTNVDGVYSADPRYSDTTTRYKDIGYIDVLNNSNIRIMDKTAITIAHDHKIPIKIFNILTPCGIINALCNKGKYTTIQ